MIYCHEMFFNFFLGVLSDAFEVKAEFSGIVQFHMIF